MDITKKPEEQLLATQRAAAKAGFTALHQITAFCCIGCGLCASVCPEQAIAIDETAKKPVLRGKCRACGFCYLACPRSFLPLSKIQKQFFGAEQGEEEKRLGKFVDLFVARSRTEQIYLNGTPGGTTTALVAFLLENGYAQAALLTRGKHSDIPYCMHPLPYIATSAEEALLSSHSKFELSPVLAKLRELSGHQNSVLVGTPCHILAFRKMQLIATDGNLRRCLPELATIAEQLTAPVAFAISINCFLNHTSMDKAYAWLGIDEKDLVRFNENVSKELYDQALAAGKDWRWFFRNNYITKDGIERDYDVNQLGVLVLPSGCLLCNNEIVSKEADASIGFYGAETGVREVGWNIVTIMKPELKKIVDEMVTRGKLERKPVLRGYGRTVRRIIETCIPAIDVMGVSNYLKTGSWSYPTALKLAKGPRKTYILGLEMLFLGQTIRRKFFSEGPRRALTKAGAYMPTVY